VEKTGHFYISLMFNENVSGKSQIVKNISGSDTDGIIIIIIIITTTTIL
jgi:hypothetical protein